MNRRLLFVLAALLIIFVAWRRFSPPPDDREVIGREVEAMRVAALSGNVNGILPISPAMGVKTSWSNA